MSARLDTANLSHEIDTSSFSSKEYVQHVSKIFRALIEKGMTLQTSMHINALVNKNDENSVFAKSHADWIYQHHAEVLDMLKSQYSRKLFQYLVNMEEHGEKRKSISKTARELKISYAYFHELLEKFKKLELVTVPETDKGEAKKIYLNLKDNEVIIRALFSILSFL